jgi:mRNA-degrading endonuclease RelE of RelBE toxin-antitoxin system
MSFNVIVTTSFKKHAKSIAKKHRSLKSDIARLIDSLEENPVQGEPLGKDCFKVRMAITGKNKGKSGGSRVITCVKVVERDVYLLSIFDKSEKEDVSDKELDELLFFAGLIHL